MGAGHAAVRNHNPDVRVGKHVEMRHGSQRLHAEAGRERLGEGPSPVVGHRPQNAKARVRQTLRRTKKICREIRD